MKGRPMKGKIKKFNKEKGYGFIHAEDDQDYFFHYSALVMDGFKTIEEGESVEFDVLPSDRGPRATDIHKI